jgi:hypothetical protein
MAFSMQCPHHGCYQIQEPYFDPKTDKVYCSECNQEIVNVTYFAKAQIKSSKQFKRKKQVPFCVKCDKCENEDQPLLINNNLVCSKCKKVLDKLSIAFINMLKDHLKKSKE